MAYKGGFCFLLQEGNQIQGMDHKEGLTVKREGKQFQGTDCTEGTSIYKGRVNDYKRDGTPGRGCHLKKGSEYKGDLGLRARTVLQHQRDEIRVALAGLPETFWADISPLFLLPWQTGSS